MTPASPPSRLGRAAAAALAVCLSLGAATLGSASMAVADMVDVPETGQRGELVLSTDHPNSEFGPLSPGSPVYWRVDARLVGEQLASMTLHVRSFGELARRADGLRIGITECDAPWAGEPTAPTCSSGGEVVLASTSARDLSLTDPLVRLGTLAAGRPSHLLVELGVEDSPAARADDDLMGITGAVALRITATELDIAPVDPGGGPTPIDSVPGGVGTRPVVGDEWLGWRNGRLAVTGILAEWALPTLLLSSGMLVLGGVLVVRSRRRERAFDDDLRPALLSGEAPQ